VKPCNLSTHVIILFTNQVSCVLPFAGPVSFRLVLPSLGPSQARPFFFFPKHPLLRAIAFSGKWVHCDLSLRQRWLARLISSHIIRDYPSSSFLPNVFPLLNPISPYYFYAPLLPSPPYTMQALTSPSEEQSRPLPPSTFHNVFFIRPSPVAPCLPPFSTKASMVCSAITCT